MEVFVFWLQPFCKTVLWAFFQWNLQAFLKTELGVQREFYVFGARHCVFIRLFNFWAGPQLIFHGALGFLSSSWWVAVMVQFGNGSGIASGLR